MARRQALVDVEELLRRLDISFQRRGGQLWASCPHPEHNDRTPSWRVNVDPAHPKFGQHRCYGCGWGGWPRHLVEVVLGCSADEAWEWLGDLESDPPLPFEVRVEYQRDRSAEFRLPAGVKLGPIGTWGVAAQGYILGRGVSPSQIERWGIGWTGRRWHRVLNPLAGRIVFSVRDVSGRLISYTGRSYVGHERRYREATRAEGADLGAVFGEEHWPRSRARRAVVVTEGAFDALAVERVMPGLAVGGIFGSQLAPSCVSRLTTFGAVLLATDPDAAGNKVAQELEQTLRRWVQVVRVPLPDELDASGKRHDCATLEPGALRSALECAMRGLRADGNWEDVEAGPRPRRRRTQGSAPGERR